jgi:hypothetical protein
VIYIICNNDAMLSATTDEQQAIDEVARLKSQQTDERFYYHYHEVPLLSDNNATQHSY